jgi:hypothetical protein
MVLEKLLKNTHINKHAMLCQGSTISLNKIITGIEILRA